MEIVAERSPITVRGVCYALFTRGLIPDMSVGSTGKVSRVMTDMRERDELDWTLIVDGSRAVDRVPMWRDMNPSPIRGSHEALAEARRARARPRRRPAT